MMESRKVALVELSDHHGECIYPQVRFLAATGIPVHLVCSEAVAARLRGTDSAASLATFRFGRGTFKDLAEVDRVRRHLLGLGVHTVVLNTARGSRVRNLLALPTGRMRFVGLAHIASKLSGGSTQFVVGRKTHTFLVLNDYILPHVRVKSGSRVAGIYLIYFPPHQVLPVYKPEGEFWVCIPGQVEFKKRDYEALFDRVSERAPHRSVRFVMPGSGPPEARDGRRLREILDARGLTGRFRLWDEFVDHDTFFSVLAASDLVMPLIHPRKAPYEEYLKHKISGAFNLAFGLGLPMFCEESFAGLDDFEAGCLFYREVNLVERLNRLVNHPAPLAEVRSRLAGYSKFAFETQRQRYIEALFPASGAALTA
jgi:hypothetical protein